MSVDAEINMRIAKAAGVMSILLNNRVWSNINVTENTDLFVYISTLLYEIEAGTTYTRQEKRPNCFHFRCFRRILDIIAGHGTNTEVLKRASYTSYTLLSQRRMRCSATSIEWLMTVYLNISYIVNLSLEIIPLANHIYGTKTHTRWQELTLTTGSSWPVIIVSEDQLSKLL